MTLVVDASVVVAALVDAGDTGGWAAGVLTGADLIAPELMPVEVTNILRRLVLRGALDEHLAALAHRDLLRLSFDPVPFAPCASRVWHLRHNLTAYDAWYVAAAELASAPLATLDARLARADGPTCRFLVPEA